MKFVYCKIGTIPNLIWLRYKYRLRVGLKIQYRKEGEYSKWHVGYVWKVNPNGFFFVAHDRCSMNKCIAMVERRTVEMPKKYMELLEKSEESFGHLLD